MTSFFFSFFFFSFFFNLLKIKRNKTDWWVWEKRERYGKNVKKSCLIFPQFNGEEKELAIHRLESRFRFCFRFWSTSNVQLWSFSPEQTERCVWCVARRKVATTKRPIAYVCAHRVTTRCWKRKNEQRGVNGTLKRFVVEKWTAFSLVHDRYSRERWRWKGVSLKR